MTSFSVGMPQSPSDRGNFYGGPCDEQAHLELPEVSTQAIHTTCQATRDPLSQVLNEGLKEAQSDACEVSGASGNGLFSRVLAGAARFLAPQGRLVARIFIKVFNNSIGNILLFIRCCFSPTTPRSCKVTSPKYRVP